MTSAITLRLDDADRQALEKRANQLQIRPGTLARLLVHAGLNEDAPDTGNARTALDRLVRRSQQRAMADAVALVADARAGMEPDR